MDGHDRYIRRKKREIHGMWVGYHEQSSIGCGECWKGNGEFWRNNVGEEEMKNLLMKLSIGDKNNRMEIIDVDDWWNDEVVN